MLIDSVYEKALLLVYLYIEQHRGSNIGVRSIYQTPRAFSSLSAVSDSVQLAR